MAAEFNIPAEAHRLELTGREHLTVSGVEDVERFDETGVVMSTAAGMLFVDGRIDSIAYEDAPNRQGGFFSRLFG